MNLFGMLEVSGSALAAERWRAEVVSANMANAETTRTAGRRCLPQATGRVSGSPCAFPTFAGRITRGPEGECASITWLRTRRLCRDAMSQGIPTPTARGM